MVEHIARVLGNAAIALMLGGMIGVFAHLVLVSVFGLPDEPAIGLLFGTVAAVLIQADIIVKNEHKDRDANTQE